MVLTDSTLRDNSRPSPQGNCFARGETPAKIALAALGKYAQNLEINMNAVQALDTELDRLIADARRAKRLLHECTLVDECIDEWAQLIEYQRIAGLQILLMHLGRQNHSLEIH